MIATVLLLVACVLFFIAALWQPNPSRVNLIALGLAFWVLSLLVLVAHFDIVR